MKYLLDTDHLSIIQRQMGQDYINLSTRMAQYPLSDFAISIVTFHEQLLGSHTYISRARNDSEVVKGYEMMVRLVNDFKVLPLVSFDADAATALSQLQAKRIRLVRKFKKQSVSGLEMVSVKARVNVIMRARDSY